MSDLAKYVVIEPWPSQEIPDGKRVCLRIDHQTFTISAGDGDHFEPERASWMARMLVKALERMKAQIK